MNQFNPFIIEGYKSPEFFCDRVEETAILTEHLMNQRNVALIASRRLGKSGLILNTFNQKNIAENFYTFYVDIYDTKNVAELTLALGKSILNTLKPMGRKSWEAFLSVLKSLKACVSFDKDGNPEWSLSLGDMQAPDVFLDEIFYYLENADRPCLVAIDEFQVIASYTERTAEATLRKRIQNCHNVHFIYSGSKRHMMAEMFLSNARPFYNSCTLMGLEAIDRDLYFEFANNHFMKNVQSISKEAFDYLYDKFGGVTWYIQYVLNVLYASKNMNIEFCVTDVEEAVNTILQRSSFAYQAILFQLSSKQKEVLLAIASEGVAKAIMGKYFLSKYRLTTSAVQGAAKVLLDRDFITQENGVYSVYDKFFELWLRSR